MILQQRRLIFFSKNLFQACRYSSSTNLVHASHENNNNGKPVENRFVPMTRKTLIRKITDNTHLVAPADQEDFVNFVKGLEASISHEFNQTLRELKVIEISFVLFVNFENFRKHFSIKKTILKTINTLYHNYVCFHTEY